MADEQNQIKISTIQLKRGTQDILNSELTYAKGKMPKAGEIIYELPSDAEPAGRFKVGTGFTETDTREGHSGARGDYINLEYMTSDATLRTILSQIQVIQEDIDTKATQVSNDKDAAAAAAQDAEDAKSYTQSYLENIALPAVNQMLSDKLWFGTDTEYNALTNLVPGCFYFITGDDEQETADPDATGNG